MDPFLEIRKLPPSAIRELGLILDHGDQWKDLMAIIPKQLPKDTFEADVSETNPPKYHSEHIEIIDQGSLRLKKSPTAILIDEWGTSGRPRATLGHLVHLLTKASLYRAADYVSAQLLKKSQVARPKFGPASAVMLEPMLERALLRKTDHPITPDASRSGLKRCRSLESLLNEIEYPFSKTADSYIPIMIPQKTDVVGLKNEDSDLIVFLSNSNMVDNEGKPKVAIERRLLRRENLKGMNILVSEVRGSAIEDFGHTDDMPVPHLSILLEKNVPFMTTKLVCDWTTCFDEDGEKCDRTTSSMSCQQNIPAFSKILTEGQLSKYVQGKKSSLLKSAIFVKATRRYSI